MSKEEFLKIQTCVLKVNIHCDGCKQKVKKTLQKIDGVYTTNIDSEQGKVTVSGNVDPATLIKKLAKNGKHAEIWGASKANNNNQNQMNKQFKNLQIDSGSKGAQNKGQAPKGGGNNQPKGGLQAQNPQFQQQLQQLKGLQDLKMPPQFMKDLKGTNKDQNQKSVKFKLPEDEGFSDDDFDDDDDFEDDYDDDFDDEVDDIPVVNNKMKPPVFGSGHGGAQTGNIMMNNIMNGQHPQFIKGGGNNGGNGGGSGKKGGGGGGGGGNMPVQMNLGGGNQNQVGANGGKKGGNGNNNGGNQNQGGGNGGKNGGGQPNDGKNGGGGGQNKNGGAAASGGAGAVNVNNSMGNGAKNGGGMNDRPHGMPNMMPVSAGGHVGPLGTNMPMGQMGNLPIGQMNNLAAVQGLPASAMAGGGGPEHMSANHPNYQQQLATMMMNQQRANGNERFQPMMYARPPPAVNYMPPYPPYPYQYPYAPLHGERTDQYAMFSDENTSSCNVM